jgi:glycosyltransferase involved in cell wall biosynthesis
MLESKDAFQPLVSIIIPVYNGANYMREAIDSALAQTYSNIEILVINDGSKDNGETEKIALSYENEIHYFYKENGGVSTALNLGIEKMKGEYFSWLSHDDIYPIDKIEKQIDYLKQVPNRNIVVYGSIKLIDKKGETIGISKLQLNNPNEFILKHMIESSLVNGCTLLIPKLIFEKVGLFNPLLKSTQDYDMWFRIAQKYKLVCIDEILILSRQHDEQATNISKPILNLETNQLFLNMLYLIETKQIHNIIKVEHPIFFYIYVVRIFHRRRFLRKTIRKAEYLIIKSLFDKSFLFNPTLLWKACKSIWAYIYDFKIAKI